ncbi:MAG: hypothetical protein ACLFNL_03990, partial [Bacteroidales bacterium]
MKTLKKLVLFGLIVSVGFFTACEDDEDDKLSYEEGKEALQEMDDQMASDFEEMSQAEGMVALATLENMDDPFADQKSTKENQVISNIKEYALPIDKSVKSTAETSFDFDSRTGTYEWDNDASQWSYEDNSQDEIIIVFPADSTNMGENNATLTIDNYEDQEIDDGDYVYYQPTAIEADLVIDGEEHVNLDMTAEWDDNNGDPLALNASVFLNPFTFTGDIETTSKSGSIDFAIDYDDTQIFSTGIDVDFKDDTKEEPTLIDGYIQYRKMNIEAN